MEALKAIKIIGNQNDGRAVFLCLPNTGSQRVLNFMRDPKLAHILVLIEAFVELRKMLSRKKLYHARFGNCSTPKVPRFCRFTKFTKMQLT